MDEKQIDELLKEVVGELEKSAKEEVAALSKGFPDKKEDSDEASASAPAAEASPAKETSAETPAEDAAEKAPAPAAEESAAAPAPDANPEAALAEPAPTMEELVQAYQALSPDELQMHLQAAMMAVKAAEAAQAPAPVAPVAPAAPAPDMAMKSELIAKETELKKSQSALDELRKELDLQKSEASKREQMLAKLVDALESMPIRKSISGVSELNLAKSAPAKPLTRKDAEEQLVKKAKERGLSKKEQELVCKFLQDKRMDVSTVQHLLASAK